jgi:hypothetical protein
MKTVFKSADRDVLNFECDNRGHPNTTARQAWFSCGSHSSSLQIALVSGWTERKGIWLCPYCAGGVASKNARATILAA